MGVIKGGMYATEGMFRKSATNREKLLHVIHHKYTHCTVTFLLILDLAIVLTSIALEIEHLDSEIVDLEKCVHLCYEGEHHEDEGHGDEHADEHADAEHADGDGGDGTGGGTEHERRETRMNMRGPGPTTTDEVDEEHADEEHADVDDDHSDADADADHSDVDDDHSDDEHAGDEHADDEHVDDAHADVCEEEKSEKFLRCEEKVHNEQWGRDSLKKAESALAIVSLTILSIFLFEHLLLLYALRSEYLKSPILVFDLIVICISIALEVVFQDQPEAGLLIVARAWRFIRIIHGFHESTSNEVVKETMHELYSYRKEIIDVFHELDSGMLVGASGPESLKDLVEKETHNETIYDILHILGTHYQKDKEKNLHVGEAVLHRMGSTPKHSSSPNHGSTPNHVQHGSTPHDDGAAEDL